MSKSTERHDAVLTVMEDGEHWFHTEKQMKFLDDWIRGADDKNGGKNDR